MKQHSLRPVLILVIDDDSDTLEVLRDRLHGLGFTVLATGSGSRGLALIADQASIGYPIDGILLNLQGILLNLQMPGLNGMAVLAQLQKWHPKIPVIMMSSLPNGGRMEEALRRGALDYIMKPFDNESLSEKCLRHFPAPAGSPHGTVNDRGHRQGSNQKRRKTVIVHKN